MTGPVGRHGNEKPGRQRHAPAGQAAAELFAAAPHPPLDRADAHPQRGRGLVSGLPLQVTEQQGQSIAVGKSIEFGVKDGTRLAPAEIMIGCGTRGLPRRAGPARNNCGREVGPPRDGPRHKATAQAPWPVNVIGTLQEHEKSRLGGIIDVGGIREHSRSGRAHDPGMAADENLERRGIALPGEPADELVISRPGIASWVGQPPNEANDSLVCHHPALLHHPVLPRPVRMVPDFPGSGGNGLIRFAFHAIPRRL